MTSGSSKKSRRGDIEIAAADEVVTTKSEMRLNVEKSASFLSEENRKRFMKAYEANMKSD